MTPIPMQTAKLSIEHDGDDVSIVIKGRPEYSGPYSEFDGKVDDLKVCIADTGADITDDISADAYHRCADELDASYLEGDVS